jgi:hypothetical protein
MNIESYSYTCALMLNSKPYSLCIMYLYSVSMLVILCTLSMKMREAAYCKQYLRRCLWMKSMFYSNICAFSPLLIKSDFVQATIMGTPRFTVKTPSGRGICILRSVRSSSSSLSIVSAWVPSLFYADSIFPEFFWPNLSVSSLKGSS